MALSRIDHHFEWLASLLQRVHELLGVLPVHVVVDAAVNEQQATLQISCREPWCRPAIAFGIVLRRLHVSLGVDRVVVSPVDDRCSDDAGAQLVLCVSA